LRPLTSTLFPYTTLFRSNVGTTSFPAGVPFFSPFFKQEVCDFDFTLESDDHIIIDIYPDREEYHLELKGRLTNLSTGYLLADHRSEEHTSELQSLRHLVC